MRKFFDGFVLFCKKIAAKFTPQFLYKTNKNFN